MTATDTLTPAEAEEALTQARTEHEEAEQLATALQERVRDGDAEVTPKQLADAQQLAEFAQLRITAAERKLAAAAEADRHARASTIAAEAAELADTDDPGEVAAAVRAVAEAVTQLAHVAGRREDRVRDMARRVLAIDDELREHHPEGGARARAMRESYRVAANSDGRTLSLYEPRRRVVAVRTAELLAAAVSLGLPNLAMLTELPEMFNLPGARAAQVLDALPALAADWRHTPQEWAALDVEAKARASRLGLAPADAA